MNGNISDRYYTINEAAALLRVTRKTLYLWMHAGKLGYCRLAGRTVRIPEEAVQALLISAEVA